MISTIPNGYNPQRLGQPPLAQIQTEKTPVALQSAPVRFGGNPTAKISFSQTWQTLKGHFQHQNNPQVAKAFLKKYGTDFIFPALFTIPVVGWAAGIVGIPVAAILSRNGDKTIQEYTKNPEFKQHPAMRAEKIANHWTKESVDVDKLAKRWNKFVAALFPLKDGADDYENNLKLHQRFQLSDKAKDSKGYKILKQLVNAKNALEKSWIRHLAAPFTFIHDMLQWFRFPNALRKVFMLPRYGLLALFYFLKKAPK